MLVFLDIFVSPLCGIQWIGRIVKVTMIINIMLKKDFTSFSVYLFVVTLRLPTWV